MFYISVYQCKLSLLQKNNRCDSDSDQSKKLIKSVSKHLILSGLNYLVLLPIFNHSFHSAVVPIVPGVVTQIVNTLLFLLSAHQSSSQSNIFDHSFAFDAPKIWNKLPHDVRSSASVASFRKKLKTYLFAKANPP